MEDKLDIQDLTLKNYRNIGIIAHIDAGKTTTTERILYYTGVIKKIGEVHDGQAVMDSMEEEKARGITIAAAATQCNWIADLFGEPTDTKINIIDTPGHVDFTIEVERSTRVLDGVVCVVCAVAGPQPQTYTVWKQADKYNAPRIVFINKMDRLGANAFKATEAIKEKLIKHSLLDQKCVLVQIPIGSEDSFTGVYDLVKNIAYQWKDKVRSVMTDVPRDILDKAKIYRELLIESISEFDDECFNKFISGESINEQEIEKCLRIGTLENKIIPVYCGSAYKNVGVENLLDGVVKYLPSPLDKKIIKGKSIIRGVEGDEISISISKKERLAGLVFKITKDQYGGQLYFVRIYTGTLEKGDKVYNPRTYKEMNIGRMAILHSNNKTDITSAAAGDIIALIGDFDFKTGDTICEKDQAILLEPIIIPVKVISQAIRLKDKKDTEKLPKALSMIMKEDPSFSAETNVETGETIISGMGQLHLEIVTNRIKNEFKADIETSTPKVAYKEAFQGPYTIEYLHKKQTGGSGQYAGVTIVFEPIAKKADGFYAEDIIFVDKIVGDTAIDKSHRVGVKEGIIKGANRGPILGMNVIGFTATLIDGKKHDVDSSTLAYETAAKIAIIEAFNKALSENNMILLEPIAAIVVETSPEYSGSLIGYLTSERMEVTSYQQDIGEIKGYMPLANTCKPDFVANCRSKTGGQFSFSQIFVGYSPVPTELISAIKKEMGKL